MKKLVPHPRDVKAMEPQEFIDAFQFASAVSTGEVPDQIRSPSDHKFVVGGSVMSLADIPMNRFGLSLAQMFRDREAMFQSFMWRFWALEYVLDENAMAPYLRVRDGQREVHPAVFHAAASHPLTPKLRFDPPSFLAATRTIAARLEQEESSP